MDENAEERRLRAEWEQDADDKDDAPTPEVLAGVLSALVGLFYKCAVVSWAKDNGIPETELMCLRAYKVNSPWPQQVLVAAETVLMETFEQVKEFRPRPLWKRSLIYWKRKLAVAQAAVSLQSQLRIRHRILEKAKAYEPTPTCATYRSWFSGFTRYEILDIHMFTQPYALLMGARKLARMATTSKVNTSEFYPTPDAIARLFIVATYFMQEFKDFRHANASEVVDELGARVIKLAPKVASRLEEMARSGVLKGEVFVATCIDIDCKLTHPNFGKTPSVLGLIGAEDGTTQDLLERFKQFLDAVHKEVH